MMLRKIGMYGLFVLTASEKVFQSGKFHGLCVETEVSDRICCMDAHFAGSLVLPVLVFRGLPIAAQSNFVLG